MKEGFKNTKNQGVARIFIYPSKDKYVAVCLDFDLIEEASTKEIVYKEIKEAVVGYIKNVCENNLSDKLLNRHAPEKYWEMYKEYNRLISAKNENKSRVSKNIKESSFISVPISDILRNKGVCVPA